MYIDDSIFLIGMGRSGSSIFYEAYSMHEDLGCLTKYTDKFPNYPCLALVNRIIPTMGEKPQGQKLSVLNHIYPRCEEVYSTWNYYFGETFSHKFYFDENINKLNIFKFRNYIENILKYCGKKRFILKLTGPPRIGFLSMIFEAPIFIDIIRDPRSVVNSLIHVDFWRKKGVDKPHWINMFNNEELKLWKNKYNSVPIALAAMEWKKVYTQTKIEKTYFQANYIQIRYEDFIDDPMNVLIKALDFANLHITSNIKNYISSKNYSFNNKKYLNSLTKNEIKIIEEICENEMLELGYYL